MTRINPCLWFDGDAEQAAELYSSIFPDSRIDHVSRSPLDYPAGKQGDVLTVEFTLLGQKVVGLNGGPGVPHTDAFSFQVPCADQAEVDRYWDALAAAGGTPLACGWIKDRFGLSWQIFPRRLTELMADPDPARARAAMAAMMTMTKIDVAALEAAVAAA